ncbi:hypothetical protein CHUAL_006797 [Chamberlinius hualienensis]
MAMLTKYNRRIQQLILTLKIIVTLQLTCGLPIDETRCLQCYDFNRESVGKLCINSHNECGSCLKGLVESIDDESICVNIEILVAPEASYHSEKNAEINLVCIFNHFVTCFWTRNDREVEINNLSRYQYVNEDARRSDKTLECSITITRLSKQDEGQWNCGGWISLDMNSIISKSAIITVKDSNSIADDNAVTVHSEIPANNIDKVQNSSTTYFSITLNFSLILNKETNYYSYC